MHIFHIFLSLIKKEEMIMQIRLTNLEDGKADDYNMQEIRYVERKPDGSHVFFGTKYHFKIAESGEYIQSVAEEISCGEFIEIHRSADGAVFFLNAFDIVSIDNRSGCAFLVMKYDESFLTSDSYEKVNGAIAEVARRSIEKYKKN